MGCQQQGTQLPRDIWLPQQSAGNFQLFLGSLFHRGPLQGSPQLETSLVLILVTSKTLVTPVNWHRDPTSYDLQDLWGRAEDHAGFLCDPVTHQLLLGFSQVVDALTALMHTPCHPLSGARVVPVMEQSRELGLLRMKQPDLHLSLFLLYFFFPFLSLFSLPLCSLSFPLSCSPLSCPLSLPPPSSHLSSSSPFPLSFFLSPSSFPFLFLFPIFPFSFPLPLSFPLSPSFPLQSEQGLQLAEPLCFFLL